MSVDLNNDSGDSRAYVLKITADGSHTVHSLRHGVTYHSMHGAVTESRHVFIKAGLEYVSKTLESRPFELLEMGFGTGLNCILAYRFATHHQIQLNYTGIERFPLAADLAAQLNYPSVLQMDHEERALFSRLHGENRISIGQPVRFQFAKWIGDFRDYTTNKQFDLVFYDAFAPGAQPELWETASLEKTAGMMVPGGVLVTYCAKGSFRRTLQALDFHVEKLPGPPGKREIVRAIRIK